MRLATGAAFFLLALAAMTTTASAAKCHQSPVHLCDGCNASVTWDVVQAPTGPQAAKSFCYSDWRSLTALSKFLVVQPPRLGTMSLRGYRIAYRGEKLGRDVAIVKIGWLSRTNQPMSALVTYNINVLPSL